MSWDNILSGIIANVLTAVFVAPFLITYYFLGGRWSLKKFFGLGKAASLRIYVGHIASKEAGPNGVVGVEEFSAAKNLESLFKSTVPGLPTIASIFKFLQLADLDVDVIPAKLDDPGVTLEQSVISLGSTSTNQASRLIETKLKSPVRFNRAAQWAIEIPGLQPVTSPNQGIIVKLCPPDDDKCFFYVFGGPEPATSGAARYLCKNWKTLRKRYRGRTSFYNLVEVATDGSVRSVTQDELAYP